MAGEGVPCRRSADEERGGGHREAVWISKIPRNHEPTPGWAGTETGRPGRGRHIRLKARQHMHGMQCHVCRKRWGGSIRGYLIRSGANPLKGELAPFAQRLTTGVMEIRLLRTGSNLIGTLVGIYFFYLFVRIFLQLPARKF